MSKHSSSVVLQFFPVPINIAVELYNREEFQMGGILA